VTKPGTREFVRPLDLPEEILPTILQTRSVAERQFRNVEEQHRQQVHNELFFRQELSDALGKAIRTNDTETYQQLQQRLIDMGIFVGGGGSQSAMMQSMFMSRTLRWYLENPNFMPFGFVPSPEDIRQLQEETGNGTLEQR